MQQCTFHGLPRSTPLSNILLDTWNFSEHESSKNIIIWPGHGDRPVGRSVVVWFWCVYGDVRFIIIIMCNFASTRTRLSDKIKASQLQYPVQRWSKVKSSNKFSARNGLFAIVHPIQEKNVWHDFLVHKINGNDTFGRFSVYFSFGHTWYFLGVLGRINIIKYEKSHFGICVWSDQSQV